MLEEHLTMLQAMQAGQGIEYFAATVSGLLERLAQVDQTLTAWLETQRLWLSLRPIFVNSIDLRHHIGEEAAIFDAADECFRTMLRRTAPTSGARATLLLTEVCTTDQLVSDIDFSAHASLRKMIAGRRQRKAAGGSKRQLRRASAPALPVPIVSDSTPAKKSSASFVAEEVLFPMSPVTPQDADAQTVTAFTAGSVREFAAVILDALTYCERGLAAYLELKRRAFPRFFFLSDDDLVDILAHERDARAIARAHMPKIVDAIQRCVFAPCDEAARITEALTGSTRTQRQKRLTDWAAVETGRASSVVAPDDATGNDMLVSETGGVDASAPVAIVAVVSKEGEWLALPEPCLCTNRVEEWHERLIVLLRRAVHCEVIEALSDKSNATAAVPKASAAHEIPSAVSASLPLLDYITQAAVVATRVHWTADTATALDAVEDGNTGALSDYGRRVKQQLASFIDVVLQPLNSGDRKSLFTLITVVVHQRDAIAELQASGVDTTAALAWQCQLRLYLQQPTAASTGPVAPLDASKLQMSASSGSGVWGRQPHSLSVDVRVSDASFEYGCEYIGNCGCLVMTPLTDRCYITLAQAMKLFKGGAPAGPAGTGKTETVKDMARSLGAPVYVFNCSSQMTYLSIAAIFKGLAMSGAWGCFDEFNRIAVDVLSVVATQVRSVLDALRSRSSTFELFGERLPIQTIPNACGIFVTMNPGYKGRTELPENIKAHFRPCAMVVPDVVNICEIMLCGEGYVQAKELAAKFIRLYELNGDLLSSQDQYDWGLRAMRPVLTMAGTLKRAHRRIDERLLLALALRDANLAKLASSDVNVFLSLLASLFPVVKEYLYETRENIILRANTLLASSTASGSGRPTATPPPQPPPTESSVGPSSSGTLPAVAPRHLRDAAAKLRLTLGEAGDVLASKATQLIDLLGVRHSVFVLGAPLSGKTSLLRLVAASLELAAAPVLPPGALNPSASGSSSLRLTHGQPQIAVEALEPKAVTADRLYGYIQPQTREWRDGLLSKVFRAFSTSQPHHQPSRWHSAIAATSGGATIASGLCLQRWLVLDGDIDPDWIESMNSVMDDNKLLTLANNERITMTESMRLVFETTHLRNATPATVSRAGILLLADTDVGWAAVKDRWLATAFAASIHRVAIDNLFDKYINNFVQQSGYAASRWGDTFLRPPALVRAVCDLVEAAFLHDGAVDATPLPTDVVEPLFLWCCVWGFGAPLGPPNPQCSPSDPRSVFVSFVRRECSMLRLPDMSLPFDYKPTLLWGGGPSGQPPGVSPATAGLVPAPPATAPATATARAHNNVSVTPPHGATATPSTDAGSLGTDAPPVVTLAWTKWVEAPFVYDSSLPPAMQSVPTVDAERSLQVMLLLVTAGKHPGGGGGGGCRPVGVFGPAGFGKSHLMRDFSRRLLDASASPRVSFLSPATTVAALSSPTTGRGGQTLNEMELRGGAGGKRGKGASSPTIPGTVPTPVPFACSCRTTSATIQTFLEGLVEKRSGRVFGPMASLSGGSAGGGRQRLLLVMDNMHLPDVDRYGAHGHAALIRQHIDHGGWYDLAKLNPREVVNLQYAFVMQSAAVGSAASMDTIGNSVEASQASVDVRLAAKAFWFAWHPITESALTSLTATLLEGYFAEVQAKRDITSLAPKWAALAVDALNFANRTFPPSAEQPHYAFTMHDVSRVIAGIGKVHARTSAATVPLYILDDVVRALADKFTSPHQVELLQEYVASTIRTAMGDVLDEATTAILAAAAPDRTIATPDASIGAGTARQTLLVFSRGSSETVREWTSSTATSRLPTGHAGTALPSAAVWSAPSAMYTTHDAARQAILDETAALAAAALEAEEAAAADLSSASSAFLHHSDAAARPAPVPPTPFLFQGAVERVLHLARLLTTPGTHVLLLGVGGSGRTAMVAMAASLVAFSFLRFSGNAAGDTPGSGMASPRGAVAVATKIDEGTAIFEACQSALTRLAKRFGLRGGAGTCFFMPETLTARPECDAVLELLHEYVNTGSLRRCLVPEDQEELISSLASALTIGQSTIGAPGGGSSASGAAPDSGSGNLVKYSLETERLWSVLDVRIAARLKVVLCVSPVVHRLRPLVRRFPAFAAVAQPVVMHAWPLDALVDVASELLSAAAAMDASAATSSTHHVDVHPSDMQRLKAQAEKAMQSFAAARLAAAERAGGTGVDSVTSSRRKAAAAGDVAEQSSFVTLARLCAVVHEAAVDVARLSSSGARGRANGPRRMTIYVVPKTYLCFIRTVCSMGVSLLRSHAGKVTRLETGVERLKDSGEQVAALQQLLVVEQARAFDQARETEGLLERVTSERQVVEHQNSIALSEEAKTNQIVNEVDALVQECENDLRLAQPIVEAAKAALNTLNKANLTELKSMGKPPDEVTLVTACVLHLIAPRGKPPRDTSWAASRRMMSDVSRWMRQLIDFDCNNIPQENVDAIMPMVHNPVFTPDGIASKSFAASSLCRWVVNVVKYHQIRCTVRPKEMRLAEAKIRLTASKLQLDRVRAKVAELKRVLDAVVANYDAAMAKKKEIEDNLLLTAKRLERAQRLIHSLGDEGVRWTAGTLRLRQQEPALVGNAIFLAAFAVYAGPFSFDARRVFFDRVAKACEAKDLPVSPAVLRDPVSGLFADDEVAYWHQAQLPLDPFSAQSAAILQCGTRHALIVDPQTQGASWLRRLYDQHVFAEGSPAKSDGASRPSVARRRRSSVTFVPRRAEVPKGSPAARFRHLLTERLVVVANPATGSGGDQGGPSPSSGSGTGRKAGLAASGFPRVIQQAARTPHTTLLVEGVPTVIDAQLTSLTQRAATVQARCPMLHNELDIVVDAPGGTGSLVGGLEPTSASALPSPTFRMVLQTGDANAAFGPEIFATFNIINFSVTQRGLEDQLLARVVGAVRKELETSLQTTTARMSDMTAQLNLCEDTLLEELSAVQGDVLGNEVLVRTLEVTKARAVEVGQAFETAQGVKRDLLAAREEFRPVAVRGSLMFLAMQDLSLVDGLYQFAMSSFNSAFDAAIQDRLAAAAVAAEQKATAEGPAALVTATAAAASTLSSSSLPEGSAQAAVTPEQLVEATTASVYRMVDRGLFSRHKVTYASMVVLAMLVHEGEYDATHASFLLRGGETSSSSAMLAPPPVPPALASWISQSQWTRVDGLSRLRTPGRLGSKSMTTASDQLPEGGGGAPPSRGGSLALLSRRVQLELFLEDLAEGNRWRHWVACDEPETEKMPGEWRGAPDTLRLLLVAALRPDRLVPCFQVLVRAKLGAACLDDRPTPTHDLIELTPPATPIVFLLSPGADAARIIDAAAHKLSTSVAAASFSVIHLSMGQGQEDAARDAITAAMARGGWVVLHNVHLVPTWLPMLTSMVQAMQQTGGGGVTAISATPTQPTDVADSGHGEPQARLDRQDKVDPTRPHDAVGGTASNAANDFFARGFESSSDSDDAAAPSTAPSTATSSAPPLVATPFRLFLTMAPGGESVPTALLQMSLKVVCEPPTGLQANVVRAYSHFTHEPWTQSPKPVEHHAILFVLCYFHAVVVERSRFGPIGWSRKYPFSFEDLLASADILQHYLEDRPRIVWEDLRFMLGEIMYGGHIVNAWDRRVCLAYLEEYLCQECIEEGVLPGIGLALPTKRSHSETLAAVKENFAALSNTEAPQCYLMSRSCEFRGWLVRSSELLDCLAQGMSASLAAAASVRSDVASGPSTAAADSSSSSGGGDPRVTARLMDILSTLVQIVPEVLSVADIEARLDEDRSPMHQALLQEISRSNRLAAVMRSSIEDVEAVVRGFNVATDTTQGLMDAFVFDRVPDSWLAIWGPTTKGLGAWSRTIVQCSGQLSSFAMDLQIPKAIGLHAVFRPSAILAALMQEAAGRLGCDLECLDLVTEVVRKATGKAVEIGAREGHFFFGASLEGAAWDLNSNSLCDSPAASTELFPMPVLAIRAVSRARVDRSRSYACPVYRNLSRSRESFVVTLHLPTRVAQRTWILKGVALILE